MKQKVVKGFTLIELIVVMAIFMVVMVAAMSLMGPVAKKMTLADVRESGSAQVNSISSYLQSELGSAEYLLVTNKIGNSDTLVNEYVKRYYEGVLKKGATVEDPAYGKGKVHVLTIDNEHGGQISETVYDVKFDLGDNFIESKSPVNDYAINKAFYENASYRIELGGDFLNAEVDKFDDADALENFLNSINATDTTFRITATLRRGNAHPQDYSFTTNATVPLVNIMERPGPVTGRYYVIKETGTNSPVPPAVANYKAEIVDLGVDTGITGQDENAEYTKTRHFGGIAVASSIWCKPDGTSPNYTFVYSYGNEMLTNF